LPHRFFDQEFTLRADTGRGLCGLRDQSVPRPPKFVPPENRQPVRRERPTPLRRDQPHHLGRERKATLAARSPRWACSGYIEEQGSPRNTRLPRAPIAAQIDADDPFRKKSLGATGGTTAEQQRKEGRCHQVMTKPKGKKGPSRPTRAGNEPPGPARAAHGRRPAGARLYSPDQFAGADWCGSG